MAVVIVVYPIIKVGELVIVVEEVVMDSDMDTSNSVVEKEVEYPSAFTSVGDAVVDIIL